MSMKLERLDSRKEKILASIVDLYAETARPVGSASVARQAGLGVSAATIRNEMRLLEGKGLIEQPHTSAGRVPTEKGYRYYVDFLLREQRLSPSWSSTISRLFGEQAGEIESLLFRTSKLVSDATRQAAVVVGPYPEDETLGDVHVSVLSDEMILVSLITSSGRSVKKSVRMTAGVPEGAAERVEHLARSLRGTPLGKVAGAFGRLGGDAHPDTAVAESASALFRAMAREFDRVESTSVPYFVGGTAWIAKEWPSDEWRDFEALLRALEEQQPVITALRLLSGERSVNVSIGSENPSRLLRSCSIVAGSIVAQDRVVGSVGVVGPTRMNYARVMPVVREISTRLGHWLVSAYG
jgi:heat-inducible transcriptional repressor